MKNCSESAKALKCSNYLLRAFRGFRAQAKINNNIDYSATDSNKCLILAYKRIKDKIFNINYG